MKYLNIVNVKANVLTYELENIQTVSVRKADTSVSWSTPLDKGRYGIAAGDMLIVIRFMDDSEARFRADKWSIYFSETAPKNAVEVREYEDEPIDYTNYLKRKK